MTEVTGSKFADALRDRDTLERELGRGGMATVYLATDLKLHRQVALKVLRPELGAALGTDRFLREIEIATSGPSRMNHSSPWAPGSICCSAACRSRSSISTGEPLP